MSDARPAPVGKYEVLEDFVSPQASVRVIRMRESGQQVETHVHQRSAQIYVALAGRVGIQRDGVEVILEPYSALLVPIGREHGARPVDGEAIVANISVPSLGINDQSPIAAVSRSADFSLPADDSQVDD